MKTRQILGAALGVAVGVAVGVAGTWGVSEYLAIKSELKAIQSEAEIAPSPQPIQPTQPATAAPVAQAASVASSISPSAQPSFESLSLCDQLDAIAKSGKSVAQFIAASGRYSEFQAQVTAHCHWNGEQLAQAHSILHPPVVQVQPIRQVTAAVGPTRTVRSAPVEAAPSRPWNNCNGIQEAGESHSVECHRDQEFNDRHPGNLIWNRDRRQRDAFGVMPESNGYSAR